MLIKPSISSTSFPRPPLSQLDPPESSVNPAFVTAGGGAERRATSEVTFRHTGWARDRRLVQESLKRTCMSPARIERFRLCGVDSYLARDASDPERWAIRGSFCHDRFCKPCANARSYRIVNNLRGRLLSPPYRFVTLTVRSTDEPLADLLHLMIASFRKLRHLPWWGDRVGGGVGFIEVKYNPDKKRWHPHLHLIMTGTYLDTDELSAHWHRLTKTSFIVKVKAVPDVEKVLYYVCKYASKPMANSFLNRPDRLDEAVRALTGRRLCHVFGDWTGLDLYGKSDNTVWIRVCSLQTLLDRMNDAVTFVGLVTAAVRASMRPRKALLPRPPPVRQYDLPWALRDDGSVGRRASPSSVPSVGVITAPPSVPSTSQPEPPAPSTSPSGVRCPVGQRPLAAMLRINGLSVAEAPAGPGGCVLASPWGRWSVALGRVAPSCSLPGGPRSFGPATPPLRPGGPWDAGGLCRGGGRPDGSVGSSAPFPVGPPGVDRSPGIGAGPPPVSYGGFRESPQSPKGVPARAPLALPPSRQAEPGKAPIFAFNSRSSRVGSAMDLGDTWPAGTLRGASWAPSAGLQDR